MAAPSKGSHSILTDYKSLLDIQVYPLPEGKDLKEWKQNPVVAAPELWNSKDSNGAVLMLVRRPG